MSAARMRTLARGAVAAFVCAAAVHAQAASMAWAGGPGARFVYVTNGAGLAEVLNAFAAGQHVALRIDGQVDGVVSGRFAMPPQRFLDVMSRSYGFVWYYDGAVLHVSPANEQAHVAIRPHFLSANALRASLEQAGLADTHFPLTVDAGAQTVNVRGPATYVERIRAAAERFERDARKRVRLSVRVFRLSAANAADETRVVDGRTLVVPGVATLLRRRFERPAVASGPAVSDAPRIVEFDAALPAIEADATTNSILIRDRAERIDADGALVASLDVRAQLVSVQTWVVDVDGDALDALRPALPPAMAGGAGAQEATAAAREHRDAGIAPDGGRALLAQLKALAGSGRAEIEVSQTALTHDRSPAVIDRHEARLARRDEDDLPDDGARDLWLSIAPTVEGAASMPRIGLRVELGRRGDARRYRAVDESLAPGECLVIEGPAPYNGDVARRADDTDSGSAGEGGMRRRLVLLIPRVAA
ncbi:MULTISPECIES: secretin N-terminal domain-containing protein [Burkholderia]|uniref:secretin N-terminal domain-containing protein n=1 Tax=Burkholderia TaxID=32008 RepID=UPI00075C69D0|nr:MULTISPECIES: secretin N-terminal domain-containing protein [Burkholderia]KVH04373.1 type II/III secretion system family protein [Burkholderia anthina]KVH06793.1 type II/III secretion system family protein [Burkholderia anthina]KVM96110.1 type II/III secretion system family protein [Burkholderia anthina]KVN63919.1 type II/III secretion system family protein [Burkholderia anthina]KVX33358.1 type II/III secretion system family protein [Burkholderia anthina]